MSKKKQKSKLLSALEFVSLAQEDVGPAYKTHVKLYRGTLTANDSILTAGHLIDEDINTVAHTSTLLKALKKCTGTLSILVNENQSLTIRSNKFEATVPCLGLEEVPAFWPDPKVGHLDDRFLEAARRLLPLTTNNAERLVVSSILVRSGSVAGTDGIMLAEAWHGIDMPTGLMVPRKFFAVLDKIEKLGKTNNIPKVIVGFGFSANSLTIYYEDNSWIKTQLYQDKYPDIDRILNTQLQLQPIPDDFFTAVETLADFPKDEKLRLRKGRIQTDTVKAVGANYDVAGLDAVQTIRVKDLKRLNGMADYIDFNSNETAIYFTGKNVRGAISKIREPVPESEAPPQAAPVDDDIPFD